MSTRPRNPAMSLAGRLAAGAAEASDPTQMETQVVVLFDRMRGRILRYVLSFGLPMADAEEIVQDVFLALYQHLVRGKSQTSLSGWLFQVAHNLSLKRRLAVSRMPENSRTTEAGKEHAEVADSNPNPEDQLVFRQRQDRLRSVVLALPETDRECLYLRVEGLRYREISDVLGISIGSIANSLARSLARLSAVDKR